MEVESVERVIEKLSVVLVGIGFLVGRNNLGFFIVGMGVGGLLMAAVLGVVGRGRVRAVRGTL